MRIVLRVYLDISWKIVEQSFSVIFVSRLFISFSLIIRFVS